MARQRPAGGLTTSLMFLCLALAGVIYLEVNADLPLPPAPEVPATAAPNVRVEPPRAFALGTLADFADTVDRPLFMATRRPPAPGVVEAEPDEEPPPRALPGVALSGIVISPSERFALLNVAGSGGLRKVSVGEEVDGWAVTSIAPNRVVLKQGDSVHELVLKDKEARVPPLRPRQEQEEAEDETQERAPPDRGSPSPSDNSRLR